ncbi:MAG TPA: 50S ribosomal protein L30, partial [Holophaga sp.]|nr:50S ribosomal protein L30 [Holophaga sp.]
MTAVVKKAKRAPEHAGKTAEDRYIKVTLVRSMIGYPRAQKETAKGLGLRKPQSSAVLKETPAVKG